MPGAGDANPDGTAGQDGGAPDAATGAVDAAPTDAAPIDAAPMCPAAYVTLGAAPGRYRAFDTTMTWAAAAADCADDDDGGGFSGSTHLAVIGDETERSALADSGLSGNRWVGLTDEAVENQFVWVTAEPTGTYPAIGDQPPWDNGNPSVDPSLNCVRFKNSFAFEDKSCGEANKVLCECDAYPPR
ncbi:MAG: C-type lectin domain-containing protein [Kofleriaceae bacterium]